MGVSVQRYSTVTDRLTAQTIMVDAVGILADLYAYAKLAYVGGGFGPGVHSVIEPAVYGCAISFGPNISILDEAVTMHESNIGRMIHCQEEFSGFLSLLSESDRLYQISENTLEFVRKSGNATDRVHDVILSESHPTDCLFCRE